MSQNGDPGVHTWLSAIPTLSPSHDPGLPGPWAIVREGKPWTGGVRKESPPKKPPGAWVQHLTHILAVVLPDRPHQGPSL